MIKKEYCVLMYLLCCSLELISQFSRTNSFFTPLASASFSSSWSNGIVFKDNPSVFSLQEGVQLNGYIENKFMVEALKTVCLSAVLIKDKNAIGLSLAHFGDVNYNEKNYNINYGKKLGKTRLGGGFVYSMLNIAGYEKRRNIGLRLALTAQISESLCYSLQFLTYRFFSQHNETPSSIYKVGLGYEPSEVLYLGIELFKEDERIPAVSLSILYKFAEKFYVRAGWLSGSAMPFWGAGWQWQNLRFELLAGYHYDIGYSPTAFFQYQKTFD